MLVQTSGGFVSAVAVPNDPGSVLVCTRDRDSLQAVIDGAEMIHGSTVVEVDDGLGGMQYGVVMARAAFASWLAFETTYITYTDLRTAVTASRGTLWGKTVAAMRRASLMYLDTIGGN